MTFEMASLDEISLHINSKHEEKVLGALQSVPAFSASELIELWNLTCINMNLANGEKYLASLLKVQDAILSSLEGKYRRPWDERIYIQILELQFKHMNFRLNSQRSEKIVLQRLEHVGQIFDNLASDCFCLSKESEKKFALIRGDYLCLKFHVAILTKGNDCSQILTDILNVIMELKNLKSSGNRLFGNFVGVIEKQSNDFDLLERLLQAVKDMLELLPDADFVKGFRVDLLNVGTEVCLNLACKSRKNVDMERWILEADGFNAKSLLQSCSVQGIFGHVKIVRLREPAEFPSVLKENINRMKAKISPNVDIDKKIKIVEFICAEISLEQGLNAAIDMFSSANFSRFGCQILSHLLDLIYESSAVEDVEKRKFLEMILEKFKDYLGEDLSSMEMIQLQLLNMAEKATDSPLAVNVLNVCHAISGRLSGRIMKKLIRCELSLGLIEDAGEHLKQMNEGDHEYNLLMFEYYLKCNDQWQISQLLSKIGNDPSVSGSQLLRLYKSCSKDMKTAVNLLYLVLEKLSESDLQRIQVHKSIVSVLYNQILENGIFNFKLDLEHNLASCLKNHQVSKEDNVWLYNVCWNIGVIHCKSEAFESACFGFRWALKFSEKLSDQRSKFYSIFFLLSCKSCLSSGFESADMELVKEARNLLELDILNDGLCYSQFLTMLEAEICIICESWSDLEIILGRKSGTIEFEHLAEIILKSTNINVPISVHKFALERLAHESISLESFDINRFSIIYRGLTSAALLDDRCAAVIYFREAVSIVKQSFGRYPVDEIVWLCAVAHNTSLDLFKYHCSF